MGTVAALEHPRPAAVLVLLVAAATIAGALVFQYGLGYLPCALCLEERIPYYVGMPLALIVALRPRPPRVAAVGLGLLGLVFAASALFGAFHAGVEWRFWPGPAGCSGTTGAPASMDDFLHQLNRVRVVSCTDAAWRFLGLSLAGWNAVISLGLAAVAGRAALATWRRAGQPSAEASTEKAQPGKVFGL